MGIGSDRIAIVIAACVAIAGCATAPRLGSSAGAGASVPASGTGPPSDAGPIAVTLGIDMPLSGGEAASGVPTANGVRLAVAEIKVPGFDIRIDAHDDAVNGRHDPKQGASDLQALADDPDVLYVVGPFNSSVAQAEVPVSNAAGLMQCSPTNTYPGLTRPWAGRDPTAFRPSHPDRIAYVRVSSSDDEQGVAAADVAFRIVGARTAYVADDTTQMYGVGIADVFQRTFTRLGGRILRRRSIPPSTTDFRPYVTELRSLHPAYVFDGGSTPSGLGLFRAEMAREGLAGIPFGGGDGILDGPASQPDSFLGVAAPQGDTNTYSVVAGAHDFAGSGEFASRYRAKFGADPGPYSAVAYACAQVFLEALTAIAGTGTAGHDLAKLRDAVRAYVADPTHTYETVVGTLGFDANGDRTQQLMSYYAFDPTTRDWRFLEQHDVAHDVAGQP